MLGQAIGPAFGGVLTQYLGFRSIFYFLFILGSIALTTIVVLLPETLRHLAGNGTICLHGWHRPLSYRIIGLPRPVFEPITKPVRLKPSLQGMVLSPIRMLCEKDILVTLLFGSVVYTVWSMVTASTTHLFQAHYRLSDIVVGFAFLPNGSYFGFSIIIARSSWVTDLIGLGCVMGSYLTGMLLDHDWHVYESRYRQQHKFSADQKSDIKSGRGVLRDFPIEHARLRSLWWHVCIFCAATAAYGFSLSTSLAVPLILQFLSESSPCRKNSRKLRSLACKLHTPPPQCLTPTPLLWSTSTPAGPRLPPR